MVTVRGSLARGALLLAPMVAASLTACEPSKTSITREGAEPTAPSGASAPSASAPSVMAPATKASGAMPMAGSAGRVQLVNADADTDVLSLVRTERLRAKGEGRVLVVYVGATWCEPCKKLKAELASGGLDERLAKVTLLAFDVDRDTERLAAAGYKFRFVPFVALPGADGHPADQQEATGKGAMAWQELLGKLDAWQR